MPRGRSRKVRLSKPRRNVASPSVLSADSLFSSFPDAVFLIDPETHTIVQTNPAATHLTGYPAADLRGAAVGSPDSPAFDRPEWIPLLDSPPGMPVTRWETTVRRKDGRHIPADCHITWVRRGRTSLALCVIRDISRQHFLQDALRAGEAQLQFIAHHSTDVIARQDLEGRFLFVTPSSERVLGYAPEELIGRDPSLFLDPDDIPIHRKAHATILQGREPVTVRFRVRHKEGRVLWLEMVGLAVHDPITGHPRELHTSSRDVTEQQTSALAIQAILRGTSSTAGEDFFRSFVRELATALAVRHAFVGRLDAHDDQCIGTVAFFSSGSFVRNITYDLRDTPCFHVVGKEFCHYPHSLRRLFPRDRRLAGLHAESYVGIPLVASSGKALGLVALLHDEPIPALDHARSLLTIFAARAALELERMEAERTLRTSESRYRTLIETSPDGISLLDLQGKIVFANRNKSRMLGAAAPEHLVGESAFAFVVPEDHVRARHWWAELLATGTLANAETTLIRRDGTRFPAEMHAALISDESGAPIGVMDIIRDITQRELASRSLRASLREKEILLKEIHHRVKNNLQVISSLLSLQSSAIADPSVQALFRESIDRVRSMALVHERMYRSNDLAQTDFAEYARTVTHQLARSYGQPGVECDVEADDIHLSIEAAVPCGLILNELVSNALKHAFPDGRSGRIRVTLRADTEGSVELIVEDNGVGIPGGFDDRSESSMGMTLIASLVEQLTGTIRWERDHGTIVTIRFPR